MENSMTAEENTEEELNQGSSGTLTLNGEAWKNRDTTTYTSLLDMYGAANLFSYDNMILYEDLTQKQSLEQQALKEYLFSGQRQDITQEEDLVEQIFSQEIQLSKVKNYSRSENDYTVCVVLAEILFVLAFICILVRLNANRKMRRERNAAKIDLETWGKI